MNSSTNSCLAAGEDDAAELDATGIDVSEVGTWCVDYYRSAAGSARVASAIDGTAFSITDGAGADDNTMHINWSSGSDTYVGTDTFADATWNRIKVGWDAANNKIGINIDAGAGFQGWETSTSTSFSAMGNFSNIWIGSSDANPTNYYLDEYYGYKSAPDDW